MSQSMLKRIAKGIVFIARMLSMSNFLDVLHFSANVIE